MVQCWLNKTTLASLALLEFSRKSFGLVRQRFACLKLQRECNRLWLDRRRIFTMRSTTLKSAQLDKVPKWTGYAVM